MLEPPVMHESEAADRLINHFGSIRAAIFGSHAAQLRAVGDHSVVHKLKALRAAINACLRDDLETQPVIGNGRAMLDYLMLSMGSERCEEVRVFFLNTKNHLLAEETISRGTIDEAAVYPREVMARALELGASGLILVHNHPSGDATASQTDIDLTRRLANAGRALNVTVHDHLIVTRDEVFSFRSEGLV